MTFLQRLGVASTVRRTAPTLCHWHAQRNAHEAPSSFIGLYLIEKTTLLTSGLDMHNRSPLSFARVSNSYFRLTVGIYAYSWHLRAQVTINTPSQQVLWSKLHKFILFVLTFSCRLRQRKGVSSFLLSHLLILLHSDRCLGQRVFHLESARSNQFIFGRWQV